MPTNAQIWQVARLLGHDEFLSCLSLASLENVQGLNESQIAKVQQCTAENVKRIIRSLVHEAAGREDVNTTRQAASFLEERLTAMDDLLTAETKQQIRAGFGTLTAGWG